MYYCKYNDEQAHYKIINNKTKFEIKTSIFLSKFLSVKAFFFFSKLVSTNRK